MGLTGWMWWMVAYAAMCSQCNKLYDLYTNEPVMDRVDNYVTAGTPRPGPCWRQTSRRRRRRRWHCCWAGWWYHVARTM